MDTFDVMRFFFDTVYSTFMDTMFGSIVSGLMIDAFSELKEQDETRNDDKENICYICGMTKPDVHFCLFRWKKVAQVSRSTRPRNISCGTICTTSTSSNKRIPPTTLASSSKSIGRWGLMRSTGSPRSEREMLKRP